MDTKSEFDPVEEVYNQRLRGAFFISTTDGERTHFHNGCWVTQCSHEPPQMLVCFPKEMEGAEIVSRSRKFALSMTAEDQEPLMDRFFAGDQDIESMGEDEFIFKETGCPILKNSQAYFDCEVSQIIENRDFLLVIGDVLSAEDAPISAHTPHWPRPKNQLQSYQKTGRILIGSILFRRDTHGQKNKSFY